MSAADDKNPDQRLDRYPVIRFSARRLLLLPLIIYIIWLLETFLLEGSLGLFAHYQPLPLVLYTVFANIVVGIAVPLVCLRSAFASGAVNMFQIGFCSLRRTVVLTVLTGLIGYIALTTFTPYGANRIALFNMLVLMLPVAIASVMVCWVIVGTHVQAYVRSGGAFVSIFAGVFATGMLFGLTGFAHSLPINKPDTILFLVLTGIASAVFFFSVREVYATALFVASGLAIVLFQQVDPVYANQVIPLVYGTTLLSIFCLIGCHLYLFWSYTTIRVTEKPT